MAAVEVDVIVSFASPSCFSSGRRSCLPTPRVRSSILSSGCLVVRRLGLARPVHGRRGRESLEEGGGAPPTLSGCVGRPKFCESTKRWPARLGVVVTTPIQPYVTHGHIRRKRSLGSVIAMFCFSFVQLGLTFKDRWRASDAGVNRDELGTISGLGKRLRSESMRLRGSWNQLVIWPHSPTTRCLCDTNEPWERRVDVHHRKKDCTTTPSKATTT